MYILLFLDSQSKIKNLKQIGKVTSVKIPSLEEDPNGYKSVRKFMIHGPYGVKTKKTLYMEERKCNKHFPKKFNDGTIINEDGFPMYRHKDIGITVLKKKSKIKQPIYYSI